MLWCISFISQTRLCCADLYQPTRDSLVYINVEHAKQIYKYLLNLFILLKGEIHINIPHHGHSICMYVHM